MKRFVSLLCVLALLSGLIVPALADEPIQARRGIYNKRNFQLNNTLFTYVNEDEDINDSNNKINFETIDRYTLSSYDDYFDFAYRMFFVLDRGQAMSMVITVEMTAPNNNVYTESYTWEMTEKGAYTWRFAFYLDDLLDRCNADGALKAGEYDCRLFIDGFLIDANSFYVLP